MSKLCSILARTGLAAASVGLLACGGPRELAPETEMDTSDAPPTAASSTDPTAPPPTPTPTRIMPLGDSITQSDSAHDSYRRPLYKSLSARWSVDFVGSLSTNHRGAPRNPDFDLDHEGHWGYRVDEILEDLPRWVATHRPEILLVHLGSNDLFQRQPVDETLRELAELIEVVSAEVPTAVVLVAKIIPTTTPAVNERIRDLNARLGTLERPGRVRVVDHHTGFDASSMTHDGVHPNEAGESHMAERWLEALESVLR